MLVHSLKQPIQLECQEVMKTNEELMKAKMVDTKQRRCELNVNRKLNKQSKVYFCPAAIIFLLANSIEKERSQALFGMLLPWFQLNVTLLVNDNNTVHI